MTEDQDIACLALGRLIAGQSPAGFATAALDVDIGAGETGLLIKAVQPDGTETEMQPNAQAAREMLEVLRGLRQQMAEEDGKAWQTCTVTLRAGGHFAMDVGY